MSKFGRIVRKHLSFRLLGGKIEVVIYHLNLNSVRANHIQSRLKFPGPNIELHVKMLGNLFANDRV